MRFFRYLLLVIFLAGCTPAAPRVGGMPTPGLPADGQSMPPTHTPFQPEQPGRAVETNSPAPTETAQPDATLPSWTMWVDPALPVLFQHSLALPGNIILVEAASAGAQPTADLRLEVGQNSDLAAPEDGGLEDNRWLIGRWVYALAAPFPTITDGVSAESVRNAWKGSLPADFNGPLLMEQATLDSFTRLWGKPDPQAVQVLPADQLVSYAWSQPASWALLPFGSLEPRWKVLEVDGASPLRKDFNPGEYALTLPIILTGRAEALTETGLAAGIPAGISWAMTTNRNPDHLTVLALNGVTALVRATAYTMEQKGLTYPANDIRDWLRSADLTHISNEVPFAEDCPYPDPYQAGMTFCSDARYMALLEDVGTDIVELTGDHFQDWGAEAMLYTLDLYRQKGWLYYGGGENLDEARQPIKLENHGNRLAIIGCNGKGGMYAQAAADHPGAGACDLDWMADQVAQLRQAGYLPIVTFQHNEYYLYRAQSPQIKDFGKMAQAGAVIVSGSQAHQPQAFEFKDGGFIHYGLGNLFFDQYIVSNACREMFVDRHIFYEGRYLGTELLTAVFVDFARPRPMTATERQELLHKVFEASGW